MPQFIYTMKGLGKVIRPTTSSSRTSGSRSYYGAKIGVLGLNGAGKSTLLSIMAGEDQTFVGEALPAGRDHGRLPAAGAACSTRRRPCSAMSRRACRRPARC